jgi:hypothetical protein
MMYCLFAIKQNVAPTILKTAFSPSEVQPSAKTIETSEQPVSEVYTDGQAKNPIRMKFVVVI